MQRQQGQEALMGGITGAVGIASSIPGSMEANTNLLGNKTNPPDFDPYTNYTV